MERLLTIGEFAQRCGLSRSALRFYDEHQLLRPRTVDEETGYRYYAITQLREAELVRRLRLAEMPIGVLRRYLAGSPGQRREILDEHLTAFRERASAVETVVDGLRGDLEPSPPGDVARRCTVAADEFARALTQVSFAIADPAVRAELGAVWVETKEESLRLVATDSYRLAVRDLVPDRIGRGGLRGVIDATHAATLAAELTAPAATTASAATLDLLQAADGVIHASLDGRSRAVGHSGDGFPDYERILTGLATRDQIVVGRSAVLRGLAALPAGAAHLQLDFASDHLALRASDAHTTVAGTWSGPPMRIFLDARFFVEAVQATVGPDLVIEASDPLEPLVLRSADTGTFAVLTMPIRSPDPE